MRIGAWLACVIAVQSSRLVLAVGNANGVVPFAENQQVSMKVNGHSLSGIPEEYVTGRANVVGRAAPVAGGQWTFHVTKWPKYGQLGWNNSMSGEFMYSPREYSVETTNHGVEAEVPIPGCRFSCESCPNYPGAHSGPAQPEPDPTADAECDGFRTRCNGFRSTLRDPEFPEQEKYVPLASDEQSRWILGYTCPEPSDQDKRLYRRARAEHNIDHVSLYEMNQEVRQRVECQDVPKRLCTLHMAKIPYDQFNFRVENQFGVSNTATVRIKFERSDDPDGTLQFSILIGGVMMFASCCGLLRTILLQPLLHPEHEYKWIPDVLAGTFFPVPPPPFIRERDAGSYKPQFMLDLELYWPPPGYEARRHETLARAEAKKQAEGQNGSDDHHRRKHKETALEHVEHAMMDWFHHLLHPDEAPKSPKPEPKKKKKKKPSLKKKKSRDGADEKEFDDDAPSASGAAAAASAASEADGDLRVSAAMDMLSPLPEQQSGSGGGAMSLGEESSRSKERDFDDMDGLDGIEIDNPVSSSSPLAGLEPSQTDIGDEV